MGSLGFTWTAKWENTFYNTKGDTRNIEAKVNSIIIIGKNSKWLLPL